MTLDGKSILVAGAAGRIGQEIVKSVLAAGGRVVAADTDEHALSALERQHDSRSLACRPCDITDASSVVGVLDAAVQAFGCLNGAVNTAYPRNAAYGRSFLDVNYRDFCENLSLHLGGYFVLMQECARFAIDRQVPFSLVNLSSVYGVVPPRFDIYAGTRMTMPVEYAAIKSALVHLTRYACAFAKGSKFRANCVSPGGILAGQDETFLERYNAHCRSKGMLDARDPVGVITFLLSDAAEFVVAQNIVVDDGFSL